jgi:hypothetical protein
LGDLVSLQYSGSMQNLFEKGPPESANPAHWAPFVVAGDAETLAVAK